MVVGKNLNRQPVGSHCEAKGIPGSQSEVTKEAPHKPYRPVVGLVRFKHVIDTISREDNRGVKVEEVAKNSTGNQSEVTVKPKALQAASRKSLEHLLTCDGAYSALTRECLKRRYQCSGGWEANFFVLKPLSFSLKSDSKEEHRHISLFSH